MKISKRTELAVMSTLGILFSLILAASHFVVFITLIVEFTRWLDLHPFFAPVFSFSLGLVIARILVKYDSA